jgi:Salmonella virulence plasmid 65kDa B protein/FG-GAP-like repeat/Insecticide toxin TcdB middle/N-terminal region
VFVRGVALHCGGIPTSVFASATALSLAVSVFGASTPPAAAETMALPGQFGVSATGAATYTIPVVVPPGTAGMNPSLSLSYSSQGSNGLLGVGWALDGLASIVRCPQTIAQDGVAGSVNYDNNDRFCLDGQRLVAISGVYGAEGTEYRTEIESFTRVISHTSSSNMPAWFEVHTKTGQIMWFGASVDSEIILPPSPFVRSWLLNRVTDTTGNYFTITYTNDTTNGQAYPSRIDYTGNTAAGLTPYNSVQFVYASRPDIVPVYQSGPMARLMVRLTNVQTFSGSSLVADYRLAYEQSPGTQLSRMTSVTLCGGDGTCLPATTFAWLNAANGTFTLQTSTIGSFSQKYWTPISGDFNGDGKTDFAFAGGTNLYVYLSNGDGTFTLHQSTIGNFGYPPTANWWLISGDFDGDGKTDFAFANNGGGGTSLIVYLSNGDGTFTEHFSTIGAYPARSWTPLIGDFNGDGRTDFAFIGGTYLQVFLSNGDGTFTLHGSTVGNYGWPPAQNWTPITGDFNGDGKTDFTMISISGTYQVVYLSNGDGTFSPYQSTIGNFNTRYWTPLVGDFNGDGKTDFAFIGGTSLQVFLSNGDGTFKPVVSTLNGNYGQPPTASWTPISGDFNGDGRADFALLSGTALYVFISNGDGTFTPNYQTGLGNYGIPPTANWTLLSGDFNGDGTSDIAFASNGGTSLEVFLNNGPPGDKVTSITTGLGAITAITYQPLTNSCCYWKDTTSTYPTLDVQGPMYVTTQVDSSNANFKVSTAYGYAGAKGDQNGRGFLGFRQITAVDLQTNISVSTNYLQSFPFIGLVTSAYKYNSSVTLSETDNTYVFYYLNNGNAVYDVLSTPSATSAPYTLALTKSVAQSHDLDGSAMPTLTTTYMYDFFNNATQIVATTSDGFSKTTSNAYTNDTTNWILGRLISASVTSTTP